MDGKEYYEIDTFRQKPVYVALATIAVLLFLLLPFILFSIASVVIKNMGIESFTPMFIAIAVFITVFALEIFFLDKVASKCKKLFDIPTIKIRYELKVPEAYKYVDVRYPDNEDVIDELYKEGALLLARGSFDDKTCSFVYNASADVFPRRNETITVYRISSAMLCEHFPDLAGKLSDLTAYVLPLSDLGIDQGGYEEIRDSGILNDRIYAIFNRDFKSYCEGRYFYGGIR
ncbi:MAG: hypothetical protein K5745_07105 [Saccharofermentans sp.]|nr:hypothetical protein [Saccharofermentans sp.]